MKQLIRIQNSLVEIARIEAAKDHVPAPRKPAHLWTFQFLHPRQPGEIFRAKGKLWKTRHVFGPLVVAREFFPWRSK